MRPHILMLLTATCVFSLVHDAASQDQVKRHPVERLLKAADDKQRREAVAEAIVKASDEKLRELEAHPHTSVALHAAWEKVRRTFQINPSTAVNGAKPVKIDRKALQQFIGFVEGRVRAQLPDWWETRLANSYVQPDDTGRLWFKDKKKLVPYWKDENNIYKPGFVSAESLPDGDIELSNWRVHKPYCLIPARFWEAAKQRPFDPEIGVHLTTWWDDDRCVFGFHESIPNGFTLHGTDRKSTEVLWSAEVFSYFQEKATDSSHIHWVALREGGGTLYVFGTGGDLVYIEAFSMKDGENLFRFCTDY